ncbi:MAG TPA: SPOR domain-containing protein [Armatimonadota bacterium]|nr:SPOR domain-containing protein [Armatimonadota bacterium]
MEKRSTQPAPNDRNLDKRMTALGVVGFVVLAGLFFCLGTFCLGPMLRSRFVPQPEARPSPTFSPPARPHREAPAPEEPKEGTILDLEITERGEGHGAATDDIRQDESSLTVKLGPNDTGRRPKTSTAEPERTGKAKRPSSEGGVERPRASTEGGSRPASTSSQKRVFGVQAGTFANKANAETLAADLKSRGYKPEMKSVQMEDHTVYRVEVGEYKTREDAQGVADDLSSEGCSALVTEESSE